MVVLVRLETLTRNFCKENSASGAGVPALARERSHVWQTNTVSRREWRLAANDMVTGRADLAALHADAPLQFVYPSAIPDDFFKL